MSYRGRRGPIQVSPGVCRHQPYNIHHCGTMCVCCRMMHYILLIIQKHDYYRQPCVATQPIMFYLCLFYFSFFFFFYSTLVLRNYWTDSHQLFRNCVFWCSLNNPVVLKFFGRHLAEKNAKNRENLVKISRVDSDF